MPRRRRTDKRRVQEIDAFQENELVEGPMGAVSLPTGEPSFDMSEFADDDMRREAWDEHRARLRVGRDEPCWAQLVYDDGLDWLAAWLELHERFPIRPPAPIAVETLDGAEIVLNGAEIDHDAEGCIHGWQPGGGGSVSIAKAAVREWRMVEDSDREPRRLPHKRPKANPNQRRRAG